jgi:hypothetical protein
MEALAASALVRTAGLGWRAIGITAGVEAPICLGAASAFQAGSAAALLIGCAGVTGSAEAALATGCVFGTADAAGAFAVLPA